MSLPTEDNFAFFMGHAITGLLSHDDQWTNENLVKRASLIAEEAARRSASLQRNTTETTSLQERFDKARKLVDEKVMKIYDIQDDPKKAYVMWVVGEYNGEACLSAGDKWRRSAAEQLRHTIVSLIVNGVE